MSLPRRVPSFVAVGCIAAAVHFGIVLLLVACAALAPLAANVAGWLIAFIASFLGQWRFTFAAQAAPASQALRRYFVLSLAGFAANEAAYAALLRWTRLPYDLLLALVLLGVALFTYVLSSRWAFSGALKPELRVCHSPTKRNSR
jgi:putative flippase GtrA